MGEIRRARERGRSPRISVIIPSLDGVRGGNVESLLGDLERQTEQDFEVILAVNFKPNGHARNEGVRAARGRYIVSIDDDVRLGHERVLEQLTRPFEETPTIGMTGPSQLIPPDSSPFQQRAAKEISRAACPVVPELTDSDFVTHMCLCMPAQLYKDVGWESDTLVRGTDPDLRRRVRQAGYRIVVVPDCWAYHPMPETFRILVRMAWRNGAGSAWVQRHHPEMCIDTPDGHAGEFVHRRSVPFRAARFASRFLTRLARFQYIGLSADLVYACGYAYSTVTGRDGLR
jgi:glycosyltransferase involved in cell wall biosynthesis